MENAEYEDSKFCSYWLWDRVISRWVLRNWSVLTASDFCWPGRIDLECSSKIFITLYQTIRCP